MNKRIWFVLAIGVLVGSIGAVWVTAAGPALGSVSATPSYLVVNTPVPVVFTISITDPSLVPTSVNLVKVDNSGANAATVGSMRDDGTNGDVAAGDKTFSLRVILNEPAVGQLRFRVSAAFRGVLKRSLSAPVILTLDPILLPPDPGDAGRQTLEGIDADRNGVRDDIQRYIALNYLGSVETQASLNHFSMSLQAFYVASTNTDQATIHISELFDSWNCMRALRPTDGDEVVRTIQELSLNTRERAIAYDRKSSFLHGTSLPRLIPGGSKEACSAP